MKSIFSVFLLLFISFEFSTYISGVGEIVTSKVMMECESEAVAVENDCHPDEGSSKEDCHCDCHVGHSHTALFTSDFSAIANEYLTNNHRINLPYNLNIKEFYSQINRPPIS